VSRLTAIHWKKLVCIFKKAGFKEERQSGDHIILVKTGVLRPIVIPKQSELGIDIIKSNMRTAGMSREDYFNYLSKC